MTGAVFKTVCGAVLPSWVGSTPMPLRQRSAGGLRVSACADGPYSLPAPSALDEVPGHRQNQPDALCSSFSISLCARPLCCQLTVMRVKCPPRERLAVDAPGVAVERALRLVGDAVVDPHGPYAVGLAGAPLRQLSRGLAGLEEFADQERAVSGGNDRGGAYREGVAEGVFEQTAASRRAGAWRTR